ncbi:MAG: hypothetical protein JNL38_28340 [Myxococcales bacterium]|nr:hypothetical protein [Myxococcales bacterium]
MGWGKVAVGLAWVAVTGCGGAIAGDDGAPAPPPRPACEGVAPAPADRAPGRAEVIARGSSLRAIAVDDEEVFFASDERGTPLSAVRKDGSGARVVAPTGAYRIVSAGPDLYVGGGGRWVSRVAKQTGETSLLPIESVFDFAVDGDTLYVASLETGIEKLARGQARPTHLADGAGAQGISVRDGWVYWVDYGADRVMRVRTTGGAPETIATGEHFPRGVVADCRDVYFSIGNYGETLRRVPLDGSARPASLAAVGGAFTLDRHSIWVQNARETSRVSLASGAVETLGEGGGYSGGVPGPIATDAAAVYWITSTAVYRAAK